MTSYEDSREVLAECAEEGAGLDKTTLDVPKGSQHVEPPTYTYASEMVPYEVHCPGCGRTADSVFEDTTAPEPVYKCRECARLFMVREVVADQPVWTVREYELEE
jgi:transposase-like protein